MSLHRLAKPPFASQARHQPRKERPVYMKINLQNADKRLILLGIALLLTMFDFERDGMTLGETLASALELVASEIPHA